MLSLKDGNIEVGEINERAPKITNGLVAHFPFDGRGGAFDGVGGHQTSQSVETGVNLIEAMNLNWRDPTSWESHGGMSWDEGKQALKVVGYHNTWLKTPIIVDTNKAYRIEYEVMIEDRSAGNSILYLGGLSCNKDGVMATQNYDYTVAAGAALPLNTWTTFRLTRMGVSVMYSGNSYSFDTVKGWTGDIATLPDKLIKFYYMGGLFNYYSGGTMYIRKLSIVVANNDTSNCTVHNDSIAVEEATVNLFPEHLRIVSTNNSWGCYDGVAEPYHTWGVRVQRELRPLGYNGIYNSLRVYSLISSYGLGLVHWDGVQSGAPGVQITWSIMFRSKDIGESVYLSRYTPNSVSGAESTNSANYIITGEWQLLTQTWTCRSGDAPTYIYLFPSYLGFDFEVAVTQAEQKSFATSFVNGSRGAGRADIPFNLKPPYTINIYHKPSVLLDSVTSQATSPMIFQMNDYYTNASISFWNYFKSLTVYIKGDTGAAWSGSGVYYSYTDYNWNNKEHQYTLVAETNRTFKIYVDGEYKGQCTSGIDVTNISYLSMGNTSMPNAKYRDLSIYNRALSSDEIKMLSATTSSISQNTIFTQLIEEPIIPTDSYYFPLGADSMDKYRVVRASSEINTVYEDSSVWVGGAVTNECAYPTFETLVDTGGWSHWGQAGSIGSYGQNTDKAYIYGNQIYSHWVANASLATGDFLLYQAPVTEDTYRSLSVICCMSDYSEVTNDKCYPVWNAITGLSVPMRWTSIEKIGTSHFYKCKVEGIHQDGSNDLVGIYVKPRYKIYFSQAQLEKTPYATPFTKGSRPSGRLQFNLNRDIGLNWNGNWSIIYWKNPVGTQDNLLTGYNIDSLGSNSNSVGGGYLWYGKDSGSNMIASSTPPGFTPSNYFNEFRMISLVKLGTTITITEWNLEGVNRIRTTLIGAISSNYFVNQYGYDLMLGGWDNTAACNVYFKDMIVVKRALSDEEANSIYRTHARIDRDKLIVQNNLIEK